MNIIYSLFEKLLINIAELIKVKSIITLTVIFAITYGFIKELVPVELYASYGASIMTYYFMRRKESEEKKE